MSLFNAGDLILERYRLEGILGRGGMGVVWDATDTRLERRVAIKVLLTLERDEMVERFRREAMAIARLTHPNIITIFDFAEHEGHPFIVMEFLDGHDLSEEEFPTPLSVIDMLIPVCDALAIAHDQGILHRDIKPENIFRLKSGTLKLVDFGLALLKGAPQLTQTGLIHGTFLYIAPEYISGKRPDAKSDQYSLGVLAFELLSGGEFPFPTDDIGSSFVQRVQKPSTPLEQLCPQLPAELCATINQAIERNPELRFATMLEFKQALNRLRPLFGQSEHPALPVPRTNEHQPPNVTPISAMPLPQSPAVAPEAQSEPEPKPKPKRLVLPVVIVALALTLAVVLLILKAGSADPLFAGVPQTPPTPAKPKPLTHSPQKPNPGPIGKPLVVVPAPTPKKNIAPRPPRVVKGKKPSHYYTIGFRFFKAGKCKQAAQWYGIGLRIDPQYKDHNHDLLQQGFLNGCNYQARTRVTGDPAALSNARAVKTVLEAWKNQDCPKVEQYAALALKGANLTTKMKIDSYVKACRARPDRCYDFIYHRMSQIGPVIGTRLSNGGIVLASTGSTIDAGPQIVITRLANEISRKPQWQKWIGGKSIDSPRVIAPLRDGGFMLGSIVTAAQHKPVKNVFYSLNANGGLRWRNSVWIAAYGNRPDGVFQAADGSLIVSHRQRYRGVLAKLDATSGVKRWETLPKQYNPAFGQQLYQLDPRTLLWNSAAILRRFSTSDGRSIWLKFHFLSNPKVRQIIRLGPSDFRVLTHNTFGRFQLDASDLKLPYTLNSMRRHPISVMKNFKTIGHQPLRVALLAGGKLAVLFNRGHTTSHKLVLFDSTLKKLWSTGFGRSGDRYGTLLLDSSGNLLIAGLQEKRGSYSLRVFKFTNSGKRLCR